MKALADLVARGLIGDVKSLKAEFRRRSLLLHPDTSGKSSEGFVALQHDFDVAHDRLKSRPSPLVFDVRRFCTLLRTSFALGLPRRGAPMTDHEQGLLRDLALEASRFSPALGESLKCFLDAEPAHHRSLRSALVNYCDAMVNAGSLSPGTRRLVLSYLNEGVDPSVSVLEKWLRGQIQTTR